MSLNLYPASKSQNITIFWIKKMFWKQKNRIYVKIILFCVYIIVLESCNLAACVALEFCSEFLQAWFFSSIFRRYCALKGGALKCKYVPKRNSCAYSFFGKCLPAMLPMQTKMIYSVQVFLLAFSVCLQDHAEFKSCLNY